MMQNEVAMAHSEVVTEFAVNLMRNLVPHKYEAGVLTLRRLMSYIYIYGAPILDVSRSHTTTQDSR